MAATNDRDEPYIPATLVLRMTARLWRLPPSARDAYMSAERAPVSMRGAVRGTTMRSCGRSIWRLCVRRQAKRKQALKNVYEAYRVRIGIVRSG
jgi:hypothetical protein